MLDAAGCLENAAALDVQALEPMPADARAHLQSMAATWRQMAVQSAVVDKMVAGLLGARP
jgi:hypothetical protein